MSKYLSRRTMLRGAGVAIGLPWLDEVLWQIVRFPNLYASIAATVSSRTGTRRR